MPHSVLRRTPGAALATALAAATLAATAPSASAAPTAPAAAEVPSLKVLSYNAFLFSKNLYPNWGQDHRAKAIPAPPSSRATTSSSSRRPSTTAPRTR